MTDEYMYITGQDGEIYEVRPTDALLDFLQRLAEEESEEPESGDCHERVAWEGLAASF